jgi:hypothetical protein
MEVEVEAGMEMGVRAPMKQEAGVKIKINREGVVRATQA